MKDTAFFQRGQGWACRCYVWKFIALVHIILKQVEQYIAILTLLFMECITDYLLAYSVQSELDISNIRLCMLGYVNIDLVKQRNNQF